MPDFSIIQQHFKPIQPSVKAGDESVFYLEQKPDKSLENYIYCYWQLSTPESLQEDFIYRVVSDGCIDIFFEHKNAAENFVMGFCRKYTEFPIGKSFDYIGVRFLPAAFPLLFGVDAQLLSNQSQPLSKVVPELSQWLASRIQPELDFEFICGLFNERFKSTLDSTLVNLDPRFLKSIERIFKLKGCLDTETGLDVGISPRQLRRIFNFYLGTTAKTFCNVVRFQHILNTASTQPNFKTDKHYFEVGFFDQAHFIKNFKTFYGVTPAQALG